MRGPAALPLVFSLVSLFLSSSVLFADALYKEEAGVLDWSRRHVGQVGSARLLLGGRSEHEERLIVASAGAGVGAALGVNDGALKWRKVHEGGVDVAVAGDSGAFFLPFFFFAPFPFLRHTLLCV
jgi:hypothetical protein